MEDMRNENKILDGKPDGNGPFRRSRLKWEDNIRVDLRGAGWQIGDWLHLNQVRDQ
jgi:hypothetical protein